jgi:hypothetical protein
MGPEDGHLAASNHLPAYVMGNDGVFRIEQRSTGFAVSLVSGGNFTPEQRADILDQIDLWDQHNGGSGQKYYLIR